MGPKEGTPRNPQRLCSIFTENPSLSWNTEHSKAQALQISWSQYKHWCHHKYGLGKTLLMMDWWLFIQRHWPKLKWDKTPRSLSDTEFLRFFYDIFLRTNVRSWEAEFQDLSSFSTQPPELSSDSVAWKEKNQHFSIKQAYSLVASWWFCWVKYLIQSLHNN